jgi:iron complex outermembrane recepter protein
MRSGIRSAPALATVTIVLAWTTLMAQAQVMSRFDMLIRPLPDSLIALANRTNTNIIFDPTLVAGYEAPAFESELTPDQAPAAQLLGSAFRLAQVDERTYSAAAPENKQDDERSDNQAKLEEVVVSAQKRVEDLQKVPISVQVISNQTLTQQNYNDLSDLTETLPAVHVSTGDGSNALFIRGIGSGENASFDQSVSIFSDDVYHGRSRMSMATFLDLDRIEVLKGPQSTFFGNNAIAGALNIVTKKPGDTFDAWGRLLYGQFGTYAAEGAISAPITDTFGVRLAVTRNGDDRGWIDNVSTGEHVPRVNNLAGRMTLDFHPSESLDATLKVEGSENRTAGSVSDDPFQYRNCPPPAPINPGFAGLTGCAHALALGIPIGFDNDETSGLPGQGTSLSTTEDVLTVNYHQWDQTFTSVSAFYNYHFGQDHDLTSLPLSALTTDDVTGVLSESYHQFSQEFRIASPSGGAIEYLAGAYFQTDRLADYGAVNLFVFNFLPSLGPPFDALGPYLPYSGSADFTQTEHVYSVFGSMSWNATDQLKLSAGLRGSSVEKDQSGGAGDGYATQLYGGRMLYPPALWPLVASIFGGTSPSCCDAAEANATQGLNRTDRALMPSAGIQFKLDPQAMLYATYTRGFKAGGFNGNALPPLSPADVAFGPEHVNAYEVGLKSKWLDDTLLMNFDVFRSDYQGLQVAAQVYVPLTNGYSPFIRNAATSVSQGVEFESQWVATQNFRLSTNITYLDSHYVSYTNANHTTLQDYCAAPASSSGGLGTPACTALFPGGVLPYQNLSGRPTDNAPTWSGSVTASYSIPLPRDYKFTTQLSPYFTTGYFLSGDQGETDDPLEHVGGYARLDGRMTLGSPDGRFALDLIGKNLTNRVILTALQQGIYQASKEQPRNVAVQFRYRY